MANARNWEAKSLNALDELEGSRAIGEYFCGVDFDITLKIIESVRKDSTASPTC
ncbi:hypothetical protein ABZ953_28850 [Streptomyces sp. NPDC046465]|uniref:hypothetical protein n=1 Tax=Streptomyces sp. NPDC046465 TaxID=3155810 RepID=UPI0033DC6217